MYEKYLEQETARLLEESGGNEDDEDIDLLVGGKLESYVTCAG